MADSSGTPRNVRERLENAIAEHGRVAAAVQDRIDAIQRWFNSLPACAETTVHGELTEDVLWALKLARSKNYWYFKVAYAKKSNEGFPSKGANWADLDSISIEGKAVILEHLPKLAVPLIEHYSDNARPLHTAVAEFDARTKAIGLDLPEGE